MRSGAVVILSIGAKHMSQMPLTKYDYMIKALASDRADQSFRIAVLPRRSRRCRSVANAHCANAPNECLAVDAVAITDEVLRRALPAACLRENSPRKLIILCRYWPRGLPIYFSICVGAARGLSWFATDADDHAGRSARERIRPQGDVSLTERHDPQHFGRRHLPVRSPAQRVCVPNPLMSVEGQIETV